MKREAGFTVIEILVTAVILLTASGLFLYQKNQIQAGFRDEKRKTDINTLYHNLEKVYYAKNSYYPQELTEKSLPAVQPDTFKDPNGIMINESKPSGVPGVASAQSDYRYTPKECNLETGQCKQYELRTVLENEQTYVKTSQKTK
jgi:type II secretory pathway pseudopilin PulG